MNKAHVIETTKTCTVAFTKQEIPWLFDVEKNVSIGKKEDDGETDCMLLSCHVRVS